MNLQEHKTTLKRFLREAQEEQRRCDQVGSKTAADSFGAYSDLLFEAERELNIAHSEDGR